MVVNIVTMDDLQEFRRLLVEELRVLVAGELSALLEKQQRPAWSERKWLKSNEVRRLLLISTGTLQTLRRNGSLPFTKIGSTIFYAYEDIKRMLDEHKNDRAFLKRRRTATSFDDPVPPPKPPTVSKPSKHKKLKDLAEVAFSTPATLSRGKGTMQTTKTESL